MTSPQWPGDHDEGWRQRELRRLDQRIESLDREIADIDRAILVCERFWIASLVGIAVGLAGFVLEVMS